MLEKLACTAVCEGWRDGLTVRSSFHLWKDRSVVPSPTEGSHNSSSKGPVALFWLSWAPTPTWAHTLPLKIKKYNESLKKKQCETKVYCGICILFQFLYILKYMKYILIIFFLSSNTCQLLPTQLHIFSLPFKTNNQDKQQTTKTN